MAQQYFYGYPTQQFSEPFPHYSPFHLSHQTRQLPLVCFPPAMQYAPSHQRQYQQYRRSFSAPMDTIYNPMMQQSPIRQKVRMAPASRVFWHPLRPYKFDPHKRCWAEVGSMDTNAFRIKQQTITIVTYNVLFDIYFKELLHTEQRMGAMFSILQNSDADIIGLQEVTQPFLEKLLEQEWVKQSYYVSDSKAGATVLPYGQIILSKFPFYNLTVHKYSLYKRVVMGEFMVNGRKVFVPVVHLSSNRSNNNGERRAQQLRVIYDRIERENDDVDCFLLGDFNFGDGEETNNNIPREFNDVWLTLRPGDQGYTFDASNTLAILTAGAALNSSRFDRVLVRSKRGYWHPMAVEMIGNRPFLAMNCIEGEADSSQRMGMTIGAEACTTDHDNESDDEKETPRATPTGEGGVRTAESDDVVLYPSDHYGIKAVVAFADAEYVPRNTTRH